MLGLLLTLLLTAGGFIGGAIATGQTLDEPTIAAMALCAALLSLAVELFNRRLRSPR